MGTVGKVFALAIFLGFITLILTIFLSFRADSIAMRNGLEECTKYKSKDTIWVKNCTEYTETNYKLRGN